MVQEIRKIILSMDEVLTAFDGYQRITPGFVPEGKIVDCRTADPSVILIVAVDGSTSGQKREVACQGLDLLRPMIRFCIENNIMLPFSGKKSIIVEKDNITLLIELDLLSDLPALVRPMSTSHLEKLSPPPADKAAMAVR